MCLEKVGLEGIKKCIAKYIKMYKGKGPLYIKVARVDERYIKIYIKGILSELGEILLKQKEKDLLESIHEKIIALFSKQFILELYEEINLKFKFISEECNFEDNSSTIILEISNDN